jgi:hypothetical protein
MGSSVRNFVIEGVACQLPSSLRRLQATPLLQTSLLIRLNHESMNLVFTDFCTIISQFKKETNFLLVPKDFFSQLKRLKQMLPNIALEEKIGENKIHRFLV